MNNKELATTLADLLQVKRFKDYTINGLQVEGRQDVSNIVTAVTASLAAIEAAIEAGADALMVHHGYFWRGEEQSIVGIKRNRLKKLLEHEINLYAYHLPLDQHPELGNNILFADQFSPLSIWQSANDPMIWHATITATFLNDLVRQISDTMGQTARLITTETSTEITHIAWCTGAAQDYLSQAANEGAQVFITGEYAERSFHEARELGCHFISCGHHASERAGICKLGQWLADNYHLDVTFFDEKNPF